MLLLPAQCPHPRCGMLHIGGGSLVEEKQCRAGDGDAAARISPACSIVRRANTWHAVADAEVVHKMAGLVPWSLPTFGRVASCSQLVARSEGAQVPK